MEEKERIDAMNAFEGKAKFEVLIYLQPWLWEREPMFGHFIPSSMRIEATRVFRVKTNECHPDLDDVLKYLRRKVLREGYDPEDINEEMTQVVWSDENRVYDFRPLMSLDEESEEKVRKIFYKD